jgi:N-acetylmuramoyl-L-alanine amidase
MGWHRAVLIAALICCIIPAAVSESGIGELTFHRDARGEYASYRLKKGETIWTHVVRRFTSRTDDVSDNEASRIILERSGFSDDRTIPDGAEMKIPVELLAAEHRGGAEAATRVPGAAPKPLAGYVVILDAGHGGIDTGARGRGGRYEDEIVYDIMCRAKRILEKDTAATVYVTIRDRSRGFATTAKRTNFPQDTDEEIQTHPTFRALSEADVVVALHLRWYLANSLYAQAVRQGVAREHVIFTSFHADDLAANLRGAMFYVPDATLCKGTYGKSGLPYSRIAEVRERPKVAFTERDRVRSERLSTELAETLVATLGRARLKVFHNKPIRNRIVRGRAPFVPAVLRYNAVPTKILIECGNLSNVRDREDLGDPTFREQFAKAYVDALISYASKSR